MARWDESAVTLRGEEMLNDLLFGRRLTVTSAFGGTGETDPADLTALEDVAGEKHKLELLDVVNAQEGKTFGVQIGNSGLESGFVLHQIGIFARVDDGEEGLLCVFQDRDGKGKRGGINVPSQEESPSFLLEFYGFLAITNGVRIEVDLGESGAVATPQYLAEILARHNEDPQAHAPLWAAVRALQDQMEEAALPESGEAPPGPATPAKPGQHYFDQAGGREYLCLGSSETGTIWVPVGAWALEEAEKALAAHNAAPQAHPELENRLSLLELMFNTDVSGNPFTVTFESMTGIRAEGIWNQAQRRLEY